MQHHNHQHNHHDNDNDEIAGGRGEGGERLLCGCCRLSGRSWDGSNGTYWVRWSTWPWLKWRWWCWWWWWWWGWRLEQWDLSGKTRIMIVIMMKVMMMMMTALLIPKLDRLVAIGWRQKCADCCNPFLVCDLQRSRSTPVLNQKCRKCIFINSPVNLLPTKKSLFP